MAIDRKVGLALGGGGARGLAHLLLLEVIEELGIRPYRIAGTSIGAIVGALSASGASAADLRSSAEELVRMDGPRLKELFQNPLQPKHWLQLLAPGFGTGGLLRVERFLDELQEHFHLTTFEALNTRLSLVATDYWTREQVVFESGPLMTAIHGSMAIPGIFAPVPHGDRLLIDGATSNPVPFDLLFDDCDFVIAVDVSGSRVNGDRELPTLLESVFETFQIMEQSLIRQKLAVRAPDVYIRPEITNVRVLEFHKLDQIFAQTQSACDQLRQSLEVLL